MPVTRRAPILFLIAALAALPAAGQTVRTEVGRSHHGRLEAGDATYETGEYVDSYEIAGRAGQGVVVVMTSDAVDSYLSLHPPGGGPASGDDDGGGGKSARLVIRFETDGVYRIGATTYSPGESGDYTIRFEAGGEGPGPGEARIVRHGLLDGGDQRLTGGESFERHAFDGAAGDRVVIELHATTDAYLMFDGPGLERIEDDDGGEGTDARIEATLPRTGEYVVTVTTASAGQAGRYSLTIRGATEGPATRYQGTLAEGDGQLDSGEFYDLYSIQAAAGEELEFVLRAAAFDAYLVVRRPDGEAWSNDDGREGIKDARLAVTAPVDGEYRVTVTSYAVGETGPYSLVIRRSGSAAPDRPAGRQVASGALTAGDARLTGGETCDYFSVDVEAGQRLVITMTSTALDPYLIVDPPAGEQVENDDRSEGDTAAAIEIQIATAGRLRILATTYRAGESGDYTLTVEGATGRVAPDASAAVRTERVYWAILCGISDYGGEANDLPNCREDAQKLADGLIRDGILDREHLILLLDADATIENIRAALGAMAGKVGPDDVFLFFYSGHGEQGTGSASDEADLRDEYISPRGGRISDDEMGRALDRISAKLSILVLDSCFSGGFSKDVIVKPKRLGLFSSEEDLTSSVASEFNAGGYLSYFFRRALRGEADSDGDGAITVGELCEFLHARYREIESTSRTSEGALGYQHLVIDRGGVKITDELVRTD